MSDDGWTDLGFTSRPLDPFIVKMDEAVQEALRNATPSPDPFAIPQADIRERVYSAITEARRFNLPLAGARLHMGREVYDDLRRTVPVSDGWRTTIPITYGGIDVVVEDGASPTMVELRWSIHG